jgi:hypothetical protein
MEVGVTGKDPLSVVDRRNGWRVIHPTLRSFPAICFNLVTGGIGLFFIALGIYEELRQGAVGVLVFLVCFALALFRLEYTLMLGTFVAYDETRLARGSSYVKRRKVVARAEIRLITWHYAHTKYRGAVIGDDGLVLLEFAASITRRQVADLARELGVPFGG